MRAIGLLALCVAAVSAIPTNSQRIMGGSLTTIDQYPSIVALLYTSNFANFFLNCGGTLINNRSVLTAAHCTYRETGRRWRLRMGSTFAHSGGVTYNAGIIIEHPLFNRASANNDIAIIRSTTTIDLNGVARPGSIAGLNYNLYDDEVVWAAGWGRTSVQGPTSEQLRHVQIWTINQAICVQRYSEVRTVVTDNMICSGVLDIGGRDQCAGDSGGPLYHNGVVVGLSSFGISCGSARFPGVNTRVSRYTSWVETNA